MKNAALARLLQEYEAETGDSLPLLGKNLLSGQAKAAAKRERYHNDPEFRTQEIDRAQTWNKANPDRKRRNDYKWAKKNGAEAARRYRARKKGQKT